MDGRTERTRVEDYGRVARFRRWWRDWEGLFVGGWLILVSVAVIAVTVAFVSDQNATDRAARASCEQVRIFGPAIADAYEKYAILTPVQAKAYRESIPKHCPR